MNDYFHKVHYYETDRMGITHHSNYVRWVEEGRMAFLESVGYGLKRLEADGVTSPVVSVECQYKNTTTFDDEIRIHMVAEQYTGVKLSLRHTMSNAATGEIVCTGSSSYCFVDQNGTPIAIKKHYPEFDARLKQAVAEGT